MDNRRAKISISLSSSTLAEVDREARRRASTRSAVIEAWLARASRLQARAQLADEIEAYYLGLSADELAEDAEWAALAGATLRAGRAGGQKRGP